MKVRDVMTSGVVRISPEESVEVAARALAHYNIGVLPVCGWDGKLCGVVTDRDLVIRCVAAGNRPGQTRVRDVMTGTVVAAQPDMDVEEAAALMAKQQVRRLPVLQNSRLCGMVTLGDLAGREETQERAVGVLTNICSNISSR